MRTIINQEQIADYLKNEWLATNGLGGYACGTISGVPMRKYHSLLNAALPAPYGRTIMLNYVSDKIVTSQGKEYLLSNIEFFQKAAPVTSYLTGFRLEDGIPFWTYSIDGITIEKSIILIHRQNTVCITYRLIESKEPIEIKWRPYFHFRMNEQPVNVKIENENYTVHAKDFQYEIECPNFPMLRLFNDVLPPFTIDQKVLENVFYETEAERGYESVGNLSSPGFFSIPLKAGEKTTFIASTEAWRTVLAVSPKELWRIERMRKKNLLKSAGPLAKSQTIGKLVLAADQFLITPTSRYEDMIRLQASGEEVRSVIAGYPWFTDWGRDTMISLEGLTLVTGRYRDAYAILHTFAHYVRDGLIPNMFPDGESQGIYNTADASLWFFHAIDRYASVTGDTEIIEYLLPKLEEIIESHIHGTRFGIGLDSDGLLKQGQEGYQLTWMDAKVGDWVVTPRRGKAVEINALWYNALKLYEFWSGKNLPLASQCYDSFNEKFWNEKNGYLFDVIEGEKGNDPCLRPNQLFTISLKNPVLKADRWMSVLEAVKRNLLTPVGLRTLSPDHPDYKPTYDGDLRARDAAYHQGTVWPWLIGTYIDVWLKVYPGDIEGAKAVLQELEKDLKSNCLGTRGEIYDASPPYRERGCFAQAWTVAEILRSLVKLSR